MAWSTPENRNLYGFEKVFTPLGHVIDNALGAVAGLIYGILWGAGAGLSAGTASGITGLASNPILFHADPHNRSGGMLIGAPMYDRNPKPSRLGGLDLMALPAPTYTSGPQIGPPDRLAPMLNGGFPQVSNLNLPNQGEVLNKLNQLENQTQQIINFINTVSQNRTGNQNQPTISPNIPSEVRPDPQHTPSSSVPPNLPSPIPGLPIPTPNLPNIPSVLPGPTIPTTSPTNMPTPPPEPSR